MVGPFPIGVAMWILTILLLFANGTVHVYAHEVDASLSGAKCAAMAQNAWQLQDMGFHVLDVACVRGRDV